MQIDNRVAVSPTAELQQEFKKLPKELKSSINLR